MDEKDEWKIPFYNAICQKTGTIVREDENGMLLKDQSGVWMLVQPDRSVCEKWLNDLDLQEVEMIMVHGEAAMEATHSLLKCLSISRCHTFLWTEEKTPERKKTLRFEQAGMDDLEWIGKRYDLLDKEELDQYIGQGSIWIAYKENAKVGFVGRHEEGSMGLLYVEEGFRRQGYAAILEKFMIERMMGQGLIPYADVFDDNDASIALQKKIGMKRMKEPVYWLWHE